MKPIYIKKGRHIFPNQDIIKVLTALLVVTADASSHAPGPPEGQEEEGAQTMVCHHWQYTDLRPEANTRRK